MWLLALLATRHVCTLQEIYSIQWKLLKNVSTESDQSESLLHNFFLLAVLCLDRTQLTAMITSQACCLTMS